MSSEETDLLQTAAELESAALSASDCQLRVMHLTSVHGQPREDQQDSAEVGR